MVRISLILIVSYFLGACVSNMPSDVELISIEVVDFKYQAELPNREIWPVSAPYHDFVRDTLNRSNDREIYADEIRPYFSSEQARMLEEGKFSRPIFRVQFQTGRNLAKLNYNGGFGGAFIPYFCDQPSAEIFWGLTGIYWDGLFISAPLNYNIQSESDGKFVYYAFLNVSNGFTRPQLAAKGSGLIDEEFFDLRGTPADVCFRVGGGAIIRGYRSNVVVIPKATIIEALEQMPDALR